MKNLVPILSMKFNKQTIKTIDTIEPQPQKTNRKRNV